MTDLPDSAVIGQFIKLRAAKKEIEARHALELAPYTEAMLLMQGIMAGRLIERGANSASTPEGTAYRSPITKFKVTDANAFLSFVRANEMFNLLGADIVSAEAKEYMEQHGGVPPPGVDVTQIVNTNFRAS